MTETLWDKIQTIHADHPMLLEDLAALQSTAQAWERFAELQTLTRLEVLRSIHPPAGLNPELLARVALVSPAVVVVDERIPDLCAHPYLRSDGSLKACGGIRNRRSACPGSGAPLPAETRAMLDASRLVVVLQADGLRHYDHQRQFHVTLLAIEKHLRAGGFEITQSWSAGPCRICPECLGNGDCKVPELRRYSMEGSGMGVFLTCQRLAQFTQDPHWRLDLIQDWELSSQSQPTFKSVVAIGMR